MDIQALVNDPGRDPAALRQWFSLALVKKLGVLRQPYHCRTADAKINPPAGLLLAAALLLDDGEAVATALGVLQAEDEERGCGRAAADGESSLLPQALRQALEPFLTGDRGGREEILARARRYGLW